ncbi:hypothetical protein Nmel_016351 [Mimus melanotis]
MSFSLVQRKQQMTEGKYILQIYYSHVLSDRSTISFFNGISKSCLEAEGLLDFAA